MVDEGSKAPGFKLRGVGPDGTEKDFSLKDYKGRTVVLYFYPKDNTPGCTTEACSFRDSMTRLKGLGVEVLGVSPDPAASHVRFMDKQGLNFPLLSDPEKTVAEAYGAWGEKKAYGKVTKGIIRSTFIVGPDGKVARAWRKVKVKGHVDEVMEAVESIGAAGA